MEQRNSRNQDNSGKVHTLRIQKIKKAAVIAATAAAILAVIAVLTVFIRQRMAEKQYLNSLVENGYMWETEEMRKYVVVHVSFPETVTETPSVTVQDLSDEENILSGVASVSGNTLDYMAVITEGEWKISASCEGCYTVQENVRVAENDEICYVEITVPLLEEESEDSAGALERILDGIQDLLE